MNGSMISKDEMARRIADHQWNLDRLKRRIASCWADRNDVMNSAVRARLRQYIIDAKIHRGWLAVMERL